MKYHPDTNKDDKEAEERFKKINAANDVLSDPEKRARYDQFGTADGQGNPFEGGFGGANFGDLFGDLFSQVFGGGGRRMDPNAPVRGPDVEMPIKVTLVEAAQGVARNVEIPRWERCETCKGSGAKEGTSPETCSTCNGHGRVQTRQRTIFGDMISETPCPECNGRGKIVREKCSECNGKGQKRAKHKVEVKVPAGVETGLRLRVAGEGDAGLNGGPNGDLLLVVTVAPDKNFERNGGDLHKKITITYPQAVLGSTLDIETLIDGAEKLVIPAGTAHGTIFKIKGKGMPRLRGPRGRGDILVHVALDVPKQLSDRARELITELGQEMKVPLGAEEEGFFEKVKKKLFD